MEIIDYTMEGGIRVGAGARYSKFKHGNGARNQPTKFHPGDHMSKKEIIQVNLAAASRFFRGVVSIVQQVEEYLLQLLGVAHYGG